MGKKREEGVLTTSLKMMDRLALLALLPQEANHGTLRIVQTLQGKLSPFPGEMEWLPNYRVDERNGNATWDANSEKGKRFSFDGFELKMVVEKLQALDKDAKLTLVHMPLWEKFIIGDKPEAE